jgi:hypothetical protein
VAQVTAEEDSVQVDAYLDALLAGRFAGPREMTTGDEVDFELETTAGLVQRALARFHPSFAFEERLAERLRTEVAATTSETTAADDHAPAEAMDLPTGDILEFPAPHLLAAERRARSLRVGGAIASGVSIAGVSIAGAAYLVRRRTNPERITGTRAHGRRTVGR